MFYRVMLETDFSKSWKRPSERMEEVVSGDSVVNGKKLFF